MSYFISLQFSLICLQSSLLLYKYSIFSVNFFKFPLSKSMPVLQSSISSGIPPIFAPSTGVIRLCDSITEKGQFSDHSAGSTVNNAFSIIFLNSSPVLKPTFLILSALFTSFSSSPLPANTNGILLSFFAALTRFDIPFSSEYLPKYKT